MIIDLKKLDEVKACPFCGNDESINLFIVQNCTPYSFCIVCAKCHAASGEYDEPEEAVDAWNRRIGEAGF